jgi:5'-deoxynucleotidase YfbR-like HD superfamily hydrolase
MSNPRIAAAFSPDPWNNAKNRFLDSLRDDEDRQIFKDATLENLFYTASAGFQHHEENSKTAKAQKSSSQFWKHRWLQQGYQCHGSVFRQYPVSPMGTYEDRASLGSVV